MNPPGLGRRRSSAAHHSDDDSGGAGNGDCGTQPPRSHCLVRSVSNHSVVPHRRGCRADLTRRPVVLEAQEKHSPMISRRSISGATILCKEEEHALRVSSPTAFPHVHSGFLSALTGGLPPARPSTSRLNRCAMDVLQSLTKRLRHAASVALPRTARPNLSRSGSRTIVRHSEDETTPHPEDRGAWSGSRRR